jgi:hypothetical protein
MIYCANETVGSFSSLSLIRGFGVTLGANLHTGRVASDYPVKGYRLSD